ncbi:CsgE family curli-type amyloid fiber assembly protein [Halomonas mongoliensis]|uniref:CsgE family curli-type amyloid fiber assembly protein n=1 Tax=Halomonas mongoliensis TaxID=321265 RepID=UPI00403AEC43
MQEQLRSIMRLPLLGLFLVTPALSSIAHGTAMAVDQEARVTEQESIEEVPGQAEEELSRQFSLQEPGITGVLIDRTITMTGKTFFRQFSQLSLERPIIGDVNLTIHERPSARWGSQIWITQGNRVVFEATMPPRLSDIDAYVDVAIEQVEELIIRQTIIEALDNDPDLADEEI